MRRRWVSGNERCFRDPEIETGQFVVQACREDGIPVVNHEFVRMTAGQSLAELLECPFGGWMGGRIEMQKAAGADLHGNEHLERKLAVTTVKKSQATIA
jgi:hypothetical protein